MSERITWANETRRLDELQPWPRNLEVYAYT